MGTPSPQEMLVERFSEPGVPPTPWSKVEAVLESAELFWLSSVRADGRPHVAPLPAVWPVAVAIERRP
jgi:Pyridoxamine 5'-phosphate oxidase